MTNKNSSRFTMLLEQAKDRTGQIAMLDEADAMLASARQNIAMTRQQLTKNLGAPLPKANLLAETVMGVGISSFGLAEVTNRLKNETE